MNESNIITITNTTKEQSVLPDYITLEELQAYLKIGRTFALQLGKDCGAYTKIGRSVRYHTPTLFAYLQKQREKNQ